jgi:hypothetical protein
MARETTMPDNPPLCGDAPPWAVAPLKLDEHAFIVIGLSSVMWGGDERARALYERFYDKLAERDSEMHADLVGKGVIYPLDPPEIRKAKRHLADLERGAEAGPRP